MNNTRFRDTKPEGVLFLWKKADHLILLKIIKKKKPNKPKNKNHQKTMKRTALKHDYSHMRWCMLLSPAGGRQEFSYLLIYWNESQDSQDYIERSCLQKQKWSKIIINSVLTKVALCLSRSQRWMETISLKHVCLFLFLNLAVSPPSLFIIPPLLHHLSTPIPSSTFLLKQQASQGYQLKMA